MITVRRQTLVLALLTTCKHQYRAQDENYDDDDFHLTDDEGEDNYEDDNFEDVRQNAACSRSSSRRSGDDK